MKFPTPFGALTSAILGSAIFAMPISAQEPMPSIVPYCIRFHLVSAGNTCASIAAQYGITEAEFLSLNPAVDRKCTNLWPGYRVCVGGLNPTLTISIRPTVTTIDGKITTSILTTSVRPTVTTINGKNTKTITTSVRPTITTINGKNTKTITTSVRPTITTINGKNTKTITTSVRPTITTINGEITTSVITTINGKITTRVITTSVITPPSSSSSVTTSAARPSPTTASRMPGVIRSCANYHLVVPGDSCASIAAANGITVGQFREWNGLVEEGMSSCTAGGGLWLGYLVCVAV